MGKECFTCANKISRVLSKEERKELQRQHIAKTGRMTLFIPNMEFACNVSGNKISQIDPACEYYTGDSFMEDMRNEISVTVKKLRNNLK